MTKKLSALTAMIAVTALSTIRYNDGRHVPDSPSADFEADAKTARSLVKSGVAKFTDPEQVMPEGNEGSDEDTASETGNSAEAGSQTGGSGPDAGGGNVEVKVVVPDPDATKAALAEAAAKTATATAKPAAKTAAKPAAKTASKPAAKTAAKKTAAKK